MSLTGHCLCGTVRFRAENVGEDVGACHCAMCRRWSSGPLMAVKVGRIAFEGEESIGRYRSSGWAERGFCKQCGTNLFYRVVEADLYLVGVGAFDDQSRWKLTEQVFIDEKPAFYDFANRTRTMTGAEVFAAFAGDGDKGAPET